MKKMKNLKKGKKPLFDGEDSGFYAFSAELDLPGGGRAIFDNQQTRYLRELGEETAAQLVSLIKGASKTVATAGGFASYRHDNLALHYQQTVDPESGNSYLLVVAAGELQPARYVICLVGVFAWE